ncbi:hypothetical protein PGQ11_014110 [Apiospora arundinis]|uniref:Uncharacterized protein n=1 Tax=Apiospora arundinis TaxID=335852 RepID=A0ABR2HRA5_9PEZI
MALQRAASLVGLRIPRDTLVARAKQLEAKLGATSYRESLEDEGDYAEVNGKPAERTIKQSNYWCPKFRDILIAIDVNTPRATITRTGTGDGKTAAAATPTSPSVSTPSGNQSFFPPPPEIVFTKEDLPPGRDPSTGTCLTTTMAGYELATYLRSRDYLALRVRPKLEPILAANLWESSLLKLMASLIINLCRLLPAAGIRSSPALQQHAFDSLAAGGSPGSIEAGLAILEALGSVCLTSPQPQQQSKNNSSGGDGWGWRRLVVIVDDLDYAEHPTTQDKVSRFVDVLRRICAKNDAPLIFTLRKPCNAVHV